MNDVPMITTFLSLAREAMLLASAGVRSMQMFSRSAPGLVSVLGLEVKNFLQV